MVLAGLVMAWRLAIAPTRRSPCLLKATTDGTVRPPSALGMTIGSPPSMTATTELVVPRSIPMIFEAMTGPWCRGERVAGRAPTACQNPVIYPVTRERAYRHFTPLWEPLRCGL